MSSRPTHLETRYKHDLTPKQEEILRMVQAGKTNAEIADALGISLDGAKYHLREILSKLGAESREEAVETWQSGRRRFGRTFAGAIAALIPSSRVGWFVAGSIGALAVVALTVASVLVERGESSRAVQAGGPLPPCDPAALGMKVVPTTKGNASTFSLDISNNGQPCHLYESVALEVVRFSGNLVFGLNNNGAGTVVDTRVERSLMVGEWTWDQWCGSDGPADVRAAVGSVRSPDVAIVPPGCDSETLPATLSYLDGRPARDDAADCTRYSQLCDMAMVAAGWVTRGDAALIARSLGPAEVRECPDPKRAEYLYILRTSANASFGGPLPCRLESPPDRRDVFEVQTRALADDDLLGLVSGPLVPRLRLWHVICSEGRTGQTCYFFKVVFANSLEEEALTLTFERSFGRLPELVGISLPMNGASYRAVLYPNGGSYLGPEGWFTVPRYP